MAPARTMVISCSSVSTFTRIDWLATLVRRPSSSLGFFFRRLGWKRFSSRRREVSRKALQFVEKLRPGAAGLSFWLTRAAVRRRGLARSAAAVTVVGDQVVIGARGS